MRTIEIRLTVPWGAAGIRCCLAALTTVNRLLIRSAAANGQPFPSLYESGVRYRRQRGPERFRPISEVYQRRSGDCDQLASWRAAELREAGIEAIAIPVRINPRLFHVIVKYPNGRIEDPSLKLGMRSK
jgi:hypothetical protein